MKQPGQGLFGANSRLSRGLSIEIIGLLILCGLFPFWEISRAIYVLFALSALAFMIRCKPALSRDQRLFAYPIYLFITVAIIALANQGFPDRGMNILTSRYLLLLAAVPLVGIYVSWFDVRSNVYLKFALTAVLLGSLALIDILVLDQSRADAGNNAVVFGFVSVSITSVVVASYRTFSARKYGSLAYVVAIVFGVCATLLSGSRGSWIAALAVIVIAVNFYFDRYALGKRLLISGLVILCVGLIGLSVPPVQKRLDNMITIVSPYFTDENQGAFNSASYRIESWRAAWTIGMEHPFLGIGPGNLLDELDAYAERNPDKRGLEKMKHAHNQYMQTFAIAGFAGLAALMIMLAVHGWLFAKYLAKRYPSEVRSLALAGLLLVVVYALHGITAVPFERKKHLLLYGFATASLWGYIQGALAQLREQGGSQVDQGSTSRVN